MHTYPVWEYRTIEEALEVILGRDVERIRARFPDVPIAITEAGWTISWMATAAASNRTTPAATSRRATTTS